MTNTTQKEYSPTPFSEEDVAVVSKHDTSIIWAGTKVLYSGDCIGECNQASGYQFWSGESDVEVINVLSGWGRIRIPELNQLHKLFVFPKDPRLIARVDYTEHTIGVTSGLPSGDGGCSGKMAMVHYAWVCSGCSWTSGENQFSSGLVDVIAFGSIY